MSEYIKQGIEYPDIAERINEMAARDQEMRHNAVEKGEAWNPAIDRENTAHLKDIIKQIGWPTISKVGSIASENAWLLAQHADKDPLFQKECLAFLSAASEDVNPQNTAFLEDRVRTNEGRPQLYGTQFRPIGNDPKKGMEPFPVEDIEHVDERRSALGLELLAEKTKKMSDRHKKS